MKVRRLSKLNIVSVHRHWNIQLDSSELLEDCPAATVLT